MQLCIYIYIQAMSKLPKQIREVVALVEGRLLSIYDGVTWCVKMGRFSLDFLEVQDSHYSGSTPVINYGRFMYILPKG